VQVHVHTEISEASQGFVTDQDGHGTFHAAETFTDPSGHFELRGLSPINYFLEAGMGDYGFHTDEVDLSNDEVVDVQYTVMSYGGVSGMITMDGWPVEGVRFAASSLEFSPYHGIHSGTVTTEADGCFSIDRLLPGSYELRAELKDESEAIVWVATTQVEVAPGAIEILDFHF